MMRSAEPHAFAQFGNSGFHVIRGTAQPFAGAFHIWIREFFFDQPLANVMVPKGSSIIALRHRI